MIGYVEGLVDKYHNRGLLVDSNLLLLYVVGLSDPRIIPQFKRTKQFVADDLVALLALFNRFSRLLTTPNIATEVSNFLGNLKDDWKTKSFSKMADLLASELGEEYEASRNLQASPAFMQFGLTDVSILSVAAHKYLVLTDDFPLSEYLIGNGVDALNFNHVRTWGWT